MLEQGWENKWDNKWTAPGRGWWTNGALEVDEDGASLIDADGNRHPLELPQWGGRLVKAAEPAIHTASGGAAESAALFVTDESGHPALRVPSAGFDDDALARFAAAAGLTYEVYHLSLGETGKYFPGLLRTPRMGGVTHDRTQRDQRLSGRLRRLVGRGGRPQEEQPLPPLPAQPDGGGGAPDDRSDLDAALAEARRLLADLQAHPLDTSLPPGPQRDAALRSHQARTDALEAANNRVSALLSQRQAKLDQRQPPEIDAEPVVGPPAYVTEVTFPALAAAAGASGIPRLVGAGGGVAGGGVAGGGVAGGGVAGGGVAGGGVAGGGVVVGGVAGGRGTPVTVAVQTAPPRTVAQRLRHPQLPIPLISSSRSYRIRTAFAPGAGGPRLVAAMDEETAAGSGSHVAMPPGDKSLPSWWADAIGEAGEGCRECMLVVSREAWAALAAGGETGAVTAYLL